MFDRLIGAHTIQAQLFLRESEELLPGTGRKLYSWRNKRIIYYEEKELVA